MTRSEINALLAQLGFYKRAQPEDEVPEEFRFSPAKDSPFHNEAAYQPSPVAKKAPPDPQTEEKHSDL